MNYKRYYINEATYFITIVTSNREKILIHPENIQLLREAFSHVKKRYKFSIEAIVIMPDHFHFLMGLCENENDFSTRVRLIKSYFTKKYRFNNKDINAEKRTHIWQPRFWEHCIRSQEDFNNHVNYIHL